MPKQRNICGPSCTVMQEKSREDQLCPYALGQFWANEQRLGPGSIAASVPVAVDKDSTRRSRAQGAQALLARQAMVSCPVAVGGALSPLTSVAAARQLARNITSPHREA